MKIGYSKFGRSIGLDPAKYGPQGDAEAPNLLFRLARRNPDHTWVIVGRRRAYDTSILPSNVYDPWLDGATKEEVGEWAAANLDANVMHLGQHGSSSRPIAKVDTPWSADDKTSPLLSAMEYGSFLSKAASGIGDRTDGRAPNILLCADPRNYLKARDFKWPATQTILAQGQLTRRNLHDRDGDLRAPEELGFVAKTKRNGEIWEVQYDYRHADLELMILDDDWQKLGDRPFEERKPIGVASTAFWDAKPEARRSHLIKKYIVEQFPDAEVFGKWDDKSLEEVAPFVIGTNSVGEFNDILSSWRVTVALPPFARGSKTGSQWTAAKTFQAFATNTVIFMVNELDAQGWMLPSRIRTPEAHEVAEGLWSVRDGWSQEEIWLARWLRVLNPAEFAARATSVSQDQDLWTTITTIQRASLLRRWEDQYLERTIEHFLGIGQ